MNIVVLAGGTKYRERNLHRKPEPVYARHLRRERTQCHSRRYFCGLEPVDWDEPFGDKDYEVDSAAEYMRSFDDDIENIKRTRRSFFGRMYWSSARLLTLYLWDFTVPTEKTEKFRQLSTFLESATQEPAI